MSICREPNGPWRQYKSIEYSLRMIFDYYSKHVTYRHFLLEQKRKTEKKKGSFGLDSAWLGVLCVLSLPWPEYIYPKIMIFIILDSHYRKSSSHRCLDYTAHFRHVHTEQRRNNWIRSRLPVCHAMSTCHRCSCSSQNRCLLLIYRCFALSHVYEWHYTYAIAKSAKIAIWARRL